MEQPDCFSSKLFPATKSENMEKAGRPDTLCVVR
jgi:hypothetical protein